MVDDEPGMLRMSRRALEGAGHCVIGCENGREALKHLESSVADLMITDIFMPEMEGLEAVQKAHLLHPEMPIVAVSGGSFEGPDYLQVAQAFGAVAILRKPFLARELVGLVAGLLGSAGEGDALK
ncbi:MAG TPA: response regulator [Stellaceae bacterium]|nr:response regulator [Stellaceae bacterium]